MSKNNTFNVEDINLHIVNWLKNMRLQQMLMDL